MYICTKQRDMFQDNLEQELKRVYNDLDDVFATYMGQLDSAGLADDALDIIEDLRRLMRDYDYS